MPLGVIQMMDAVSKKLSVIKFSVDEEKVGENF